MHHEADDAEARVLVFHTDALNVSVCHGNGVRYFGNHPALALQFNPKLHREFIGNVLGPLQVGQPGTAFIVLRQAGTGI